MQISIKNIKSILSITLAAAIFILPAAALAAGAVPNIGLFASVFGTATLAQIIIRLVQLFIALLGVIAVLLLIYAGFTWMTAAGDPAKVEKAKRIIQQAIIGLVVIFSAYAISAFLMSYFNPVTPPVSQSCETIGEVRECDIGVCAGTQTCSAGNLWGSCVKLDPDCPNIYTETLKPIITYIDPAVDTLGNTDRSNLVIASTTDDISNGAPGNAITIFGRYFGQVKGKVYFVSRENGLRTEAQIAPCFGSWTGNQIIAVVPEGLNQAGADSESDIATAEPLRNYDIIVEKKSTAATPPESDPWGFQVNRLVRPGLCSIQPNHGAYPATTTLSGWLFPTAAPQNVIWTLSPYQTTSTAGSWTSKTAIDVVPQDLSGRSLVNIFNGTARSNSFLFQVSRGEIGSPCGYDSQSCREDITTCDTGAVCQYCSDDPEADNYQPGCVVSKNCTCQVNPTEACVYNADPALNASRSCTIGGCSGNELCSASGVWSHTCSLPANSTCVPYLGGSSSISAFTWSFAALKRPAPGMSCVSDLWSDGTCDVNGCIDSSLGCDFSVTTEEWLELYNPTDAEVNLNNWSIKYSIGGTPLVYKSFGSTDVIPAKGYLQVMNSAVPLPVTGVILSLNDGTTEKDSVAYGMNGVAPAFSPASAGRKIDGLDTNNAADFVYLANSTAGQPNGPIATTSVGYPVINEFSLKHDACTCVPKSQLCVAGTVDRATCQPIGQCAQVRTCENTGHYGSCVQADPNCIPYSIVPASTIASYSWKFGANQTPPPDGPMVVRDCDGSGTCQDFLPSPSPWEGWTSANTPSITNEKACINSEIYARFTQTISADTLSLSNIGLYKKVGTAWVDQRDKIDGIETLLSDGEAVDSFAIKLEQKLDYDATYRIFLSRRIRDELGRNLTDNPIGPNQELCDEGIGSPSSTPGVCWSFITRSSDDDPMCKVGCVNCGPGQYFNRYFGQEKKQKVTPISQDNVCITLDNGDYAWNWSENEQNPGGAETNGWNLQEIKAAAYSWLTDPLAVDGTGIASQPANTPASGFGTTTALQESQWRTNAEYESWFGGDDFDYFGIKGQIASTGGQFGICKAHNNFTDPIVIESQYCTRNDAEPGKRILQSPSPWKGQTDACINAVIFVLFSRNMQNSSLLTGSGEIKTIKNFDIYKCDSGASATSTDFEAKTDCAPQNGWKAQIFNHTNQSISMEDIVGAADSSNNYAAPEGVKITPSGNNGRLDPNSWYRVVIHGHYDGVRGGVTTTVAGVERAEGVLQVPSRNARLIKDEETWYYWYFKTGSEDCPIDQVAVLPQTRFMELVGETQSYLADPYAANCNHLNADLYTWKWDSLINPFTDRCVDPNPDSGDTVATICDKDASSCPIPASGSNVEPAVKPNSVVKAFGQGIGRTNITAAAVQGVCSANVWGAGDLQVGRGQFEVSGHDNSMCLNADLSINFSQDAKSLSLDENVLLYRCQDAECLTVDEPNPLDIKFSLPQGMPGSPNPLYTNKVSFAPKNNLVAGQTYRVVVRGGANGVTSASGNELQKLNFNLTPNAGGEACDPTVYPWRLGDPQYNYCSATDCKLTGDLCGTSLQECDKDTDPLCDAECHKTGNVNYQASCGNSRIEIGEDCDDGNIISGDSCSSNCLLEGSNPSYGSLCGNGKVEKGENCDDGNASNADGCSSKCLLEGLLNNVLTNVDFEEGAVGSKPVNWVVSSQQHSSVAISDEESRSGKKSVKIVQDPNQAYPGICNQATCENLPAALGCTWLQKTAPEISQCRFNNPDNKHPTDPNPLYNEGEELVWGNSNRVMWGTLYYDVSNIGLKVGQTYDIQFYYKGLIDPKSRLDAIFSYSPGWARQCQAKVAPNINTDGSCKIGSQCADNPNYCCAQATEQTDCYTYYDLPSVKTSRSDKWEEYSAEFIYTEELAKLRKKDGKLSNTIAISIPYADITVGTELYIDDFSVRRVGSDPDAPICGNSKIEAGEQCDDGSKNGVNSRCRENCLLSGAEKYVIGGDGTCGNDKVENGQFDSYSWKFTLPADAEVCLPASWGVNPCPNGVWSLTADASVNKLDVTFYKGGSGAKPNDPKCISDAQMNNIGFWRRIYDQMVRIVKSFFGFRTVIAADYWCAINTPADGSFIASDLAQMRRGNYKDDIKIDSSVNNTEVIAYTGDSDNYKINFIRDADWQPNTEYKMVAVYERLGGAAGTTSATVTTYGEVCQMNDVRFDVWPRGNSKESDAFFCASDPSTGKPDDCGRFSEDLYDDDMSAGWTFGRKGNGYSIGSSGETIDSVYKPGNQHLYRVWPLGDRDGGNRDYVLRGTSFDSNLANVGAVSAVDGVSLTAYAGDFWATAGFNPGISILHVTANDSVNGLSISDDLPIRTFICDTPWPDPQNFPFIDSSNNCTAGTGQCDNTNFGTYYCRDAGIGKSCSNNSDQACTTDESCGVGNSCVLHTADDLPSIANYNANTGMFDSGSAIIKGNAGNECATLPSSFAIKTAYYNSYDDKAYLWGRDNNVYSGSFSQGWTKVDKGGWQKKGLPANFSPVVGYSFTSPVDGVNRTYLWDAGGRYLSYDGAEWKTAGKGNLSSGFRPTVGYVLRNNVGNDLRIELWDAAGNYKVSVDGSAWTDGSKPSDPANFKAVIGYANPDDSRIHVWDSAGNYRFKIGNDWSIGTGQPAAIKPNAAFFDGTNSFISQGAQAFLGDGASWTRVALTDKTCDNKIKEFLFTGMAQSGGSSVDAIGLRTYNNNNHYSPELWYKSRFNPFLQGNLSKLNIDGYSAVQEGRTTYVNAADFSDDTNTSEVNGLEKVRTDIYLMSYNQNAGTTTEKIYKQLVANWFFNAGTKASGGLEYFAALGYCSEGGGVVSGNRCLTDNDCIRRNAGYCTSFDSAAGTLAYKAKITRDTQRLADIQDMNVSVNSYYAKTRCSNDFSRACKVNADCFGGGACGNFYPNLSAGTYITGKTYSVWPSWQETLGKQLGIKLPVDPINKFWKWENSTSVTCSDPFNPITCWDEVGKQMASVGGTCNLDWDSAVYAYYGTKTGTSTKVYAKGEVFPNGAGWKPDWKFVNNLSYNPFDGYHSQITGGQFCQTVSDTCGNGDKDVSLGENCSTCPMDFGCGVNETCQKVSGSWECKPLRACGDGELQPSEECDGGAAGVAGCTLCESATSCSNGCQLESGYVADGNGHAVPRCGDGLIKSPEQCDFLNGVPFQTVGTPITNTYNGALACTDQCKLADWYAVDAKFNPVCGDGLRTDQEECDCGLTGGAFSAGSAKNNPFVCNKVNQPLPTDYAYNAILEPDKPFCGTDCQRYDHGNFLTCGDGILTSGHEVCEFADNPYCCGETTCQLDSACIGGGCLNGCCWRPGDGICMNGENGTKNCGETVSMPTPSCSDDCRQCEASDPCCNNATCTWVPAGNADDDGSGNICTADHTVTAGCPPAFLSNPFGIPETMNADVVDLPLTIPAVCTQTNPVTLNFSVTRNITKPDIGIVFVTDLSGTMNPPNSYDYPGYDYACKKDDGDGRCSDTCRFMKGKETYWDDCEPNKRGEEDSCITPAGSGSCSAPPGRGLIYSLQSSLARIYLGITPLSNTVQVGITDFGGPPPDGGDAVGRYRANLNLLTEGWRLFLADRVASYRTIPGNTPTAYGVMSGRDILYGLQGPNVKRIFIILSDGQVNPGYHPTCFTDSCINLFTQMRDNDVEVYSAVFSLGAERIETMRQWSNNVLTGTACDSISEETKRGYCFSSISGSVQAIYENIVNQIIDSITFKTKVTLKWHDGTTEKIEEVIVDSNADPKSLTIDLPPSACGQPITMTVDGLNDSDEPVGTLNVTSQPLKYCGPAPIIGVKDNNPYARVAGAFESVLPSRLSSWWSVLLELLTGLIPHNVIASFVK